MEGDGWVESRLEPAMFYRRDDSGRLNGVLVTHVDDLEGGVQPGLEQELFRNSSKSLGFATNPRLSKTLRKILTIQEVFLGSL